MEGNLAAVTLVTFFHNLFTAVWIGGMISLGLAALPAARSALGKSLQARALIGALQKRQSLLAYLSMAGLALTGVLLARRADQFAGLLTFSGTYSTVLSLKHLLTAAMVAIALYRSLGLGRKAGALSPTQEKLNAGLLIANIALGIGVLLLSALLAAL